MTSKNIAFRVCVLVCAAAFALCGCSALVKSVQDNITQKKIPVEVVTVTTKLPEVLACIERPQGLCTAPPGLRDVSLHLTGDVCNTLRGEAEIARSFATKAICDPTAAGLEDIMNAAAGRPRAAKAVSLSRMGSQAFAKSLFDAANTRSWTQANRLLVSRVRELRSQATGRALAGLEVERLSAFTQAVDFTSVLAGYFSDYFDGGQFVSLSIDPSSLEASVQKELEDKMGLPASSAKDLVNDVLAQIKGQSLGTDGKYHLVTAKTDGGFVTRGGDKYVFPVVSVTFTPGAKQAVNISKVDFTTVGADVMRVFVEAVGDYWAQMPGVAQSSGVKYKVLRTFGIDPAHEQIDETQFKQINDWSSSAEAAAAGATGQLIRGVAWLSLNNEALAKVIETAVGVAARKASEKVTWCVEACAKAVDTTSFQGGSVTFSTTQVTLVE
jgi:hypothetical protein